MAELVAEAEAGAMVEAVRALLEAAELRELPYPNALAELALAQAAMVEGGNTHASVALRGTLERLAEEADLHTVRDGPLFSVLDIASSITREGIVPTSTLAVAMLEAGFAELLTRYPPPMYPQGWRGSEPDGDPADFAGGAWPQVHPFEFWPDAACPYCANSSPADLRVDGPVDSGE